MQKHTWAAAAAIVSGMVLAFGQPTLAKGAHAGGGRLGKMSTALGLTDAQKAQMKPLLKSQREQVKAIKADTTLSPADSKAKIKAIRQGTTAQIKAMLTPDQKTKLMEMRHHRKKDKDTTAVAPAAKPAF